MRSLLILGPIVVLASISVIAPGQSGRSAHAASPPAPGLDFSIDTDGDGIDDCSTGGPVTTCSLPINAEFTVRVYLNSLPDDIGEYGGFDIQIAHFGVASLDDANFDPWPDCATGASHFTPTWFAVGCAVGRPPSGLSTYIGIIAQASFDCNVSGWMTLSNGEGHTDLATTVADPLWGQVTRTYHEPNGIETLTIECGDPPAPPPPPDVHGDANCDGRIDSRDAAVVLQFDARLLHSVPCGRNADTQKEGSVNAIDAYWILQFSAGLISEMPQPAWLPIGVAPP